LLFLFYFLETQHVSDINVPIFRSLRLCCWTTTLAVSFCKDGGVSVSINLWCLVVCVWCDVFCRFFVSSNMLLLMLTVVTFYACCTCCFLVCSVIHHWFVIWHAASVHYCYVSEIVHTLVCCVLELGCGSARVVSGLPSEAQLVYSCGMWGLGVNNRLK